MLSLQKLVFVSKGTTVECFAVQMVSDGNLLVIYYMGLAMRKPVFRVYEKTRHKPVSSAT